MAMQPSGTFTLSKEEHISGRTLTERLFKGGESRSMSYYPIRVVYCLTEREEAAARIMVSVPKRYFKRAVKRNRVKRQLREAYRKNKHLLDACLSEIGERSLAMAFIWMDDHLHDSAYVEERMCKLMVRITERI